LFLIIENGFVIISHLHLLHPINKGERQYQRINPYTLHP